MLVQKRGDKMKFAKENSSERLQIRVTKKEKEYLKEEASKRGLSISELVKNALDKYLK